MKKVLLLLICMLALTACSVNVENENPEEANAISFLENNSDAAILSYTGNEIIYYETSEENQGINALILYECDLLSGKKKQLGEVSNFFMTTNSAVLMDEGIAFTVCSQEEDRLVNKVYYAKDEELFDIHAWDTNIPMAYVEKISQEELLLFYPDQVAEGNDEFYSYELMKLNVNNDKKGKLTKFTYNISRQEGEIVPTVDVYNNRIYAFKNTVQDGENHYSICSLDLEGNLLNEYQVDIDDFLYLEAVSSYDSVYRMECLDEELFVLQTLNSRIILLKKVNDEMVRVNIPEVLSAFPEGYKIVKDYESDGSAVYFVNMFQDNIIKLNVASKMFSELNLSEKLGISCVNSLNMNPDGELLVKADEHAYIIGEGDYKLLEEYSVQDYAQEASVQEDQVAEENDEEKHDEEKTLYNPNPELISITEHRYEKNESFIEFSDLPENDAETIACHDLLGSIMGDSEDWESVYEWIKVESIDTLTFEELKEREEYTPLFKQLWLKLSSGVTFDHYVETILNNGCVVVCVQFEDKLKEEHKTIQYGDGEFEIFWLFAPNEELYLEVFDNTRYYGLFNFYKEDKEDVPGALYVSGS